MLSSSSRILFAKRFANSLISVSSSKGMACEGSFHFGKERFFTRRQDAALADIRGTEALEDILCLKSRRVYKVHPYIHTPWTTQRMVKAFCIVRGGAQNTMKQ
jgi:hypothetical protein